MNKKHKDLVIFYFTLFYLKISATSLYAAIPLLLNQKFTLEFLRQGLSAWIIAVWFLFGAYKIAQISLSEKGVEFFLCPVYLLKAIIMVPFMAFLSFDDIIKQGDKKE